MRFEYFIFKKISNNSSSSISSFITKISVIATALSLAVMIISTSFIDGFQFEVQSKIFDFWAHYHIKPYTLTQSYSESPMKRDEELIKEIKKEKEVKYVQTVVYKGALIKTDESVEGVVLRGIGEDFYRPSINKFITQGAMIQLSSKEINAPLKNEIMISEITAKRLNLKLNQDIIISFMDREIRLRKFTIIGIYKTGIETFDKQFAIVDMKILQKLNKWSFDSISSIEIYIKNPLMMESVGQRLKNKVNNPSVEILSIKEIRPDIFDWLNLQRTNELIILVMMFIVAVINMSTSLLILILERTNMIGILKALGVRDDMLGRIFLLQSFYITLKGIAWGLFIGIGLCWLQDNYHFIKLEEESYYLAYAPIAFNGIKILSITIGTLVLSTIIMVIPTYLVTKISPVKVIEFK